MITLSIHELNLTRYLLKLTSKQKLVIASFIVILLNSAISRDVKR